MVQSNGIALPGTLLMTDLASTSMHSIPRNSGVSNRRLAIPEMFLATDATRRVQEGDVVERDVTSAKPGQARRRSRAAGSRLRLVSGE